jgi:hypothetical protein
MSLFVHLTEISDAIQFHAKVVPVLLPDLREEIGQCERRGLMHDACMVRYVDLVPRR